MIVSLSDVRYDDLIRWRRRHLAETVPQVGNNRAALKGFGSAIDVIGLVCQNAGHIIGQNLIASTVAHKERAIGAKCQRPRRLQRCLRKCGSGQQDRGGGAK